MEFSFLIKGVLLGFSIAAPVGPIGILCIRRTLAQGMAFGIFSGLGAAVADTIYGLMAVFGLTVISQFLVAQRFLLGLVGGIFLSYVGITTFLAKPTTQIQEPVSGGGLARAFSTTFFLTLANPVTIIAFMAITAGMGLTITNDYSTAMLFVLGVFLGSTFWWLILSGFVGFLRGTITPNMIIWINKISGLLIIAFAVVTLVSLY